MNSGDSLKIIIDIMENINIKMAIFIKVIGKTM